MHSATFAFIKMQDVFVFLLTTNLDTVGRCLIIYCSCENTDFNVNIEQNQAYNATLI